MPSRPRSAAQPAADGQPTAAPPSIATSSIFAVACWPITVVLAGVTHTIPAMPAADWLAVLTAEDPGMEIIDLLDNADDLLVQMAEGLIDAIDLQAVILDVITLVSGRPWWVTLRLLAAAAGAWDTIGGHLALKGVDAQRIPLQAWMDALLATVLLHVEPKNHVSMLARLKAPPAGQAPAIDEEAEAAAFMQAMRGG